MNMRILIDADGCPVVDIAAKMARKNSIECIIICDTSHIFEKEGASTVTVSKGPDSVDFALVNMITGGDIIITQDYGLAAMCLARRGTAISQDGLEYTDSNMDALLFSRYSSKKIRSSGGRLKGPPKRTSDQDRLFEETLNRLIVHSNFR